MITEAIATVGAPLESSQLSSQFLAPATNAATPAGFGEWFSGELAAVNDRLVSADQDLQKLAVGATENLHEVMINLEEARLSFQLLAQVRNKLLEAYQEVMRMQV